LCLQRRQNLHKASAIDPLIEEKRKRGEKREEAKRRGKGEQKGREVYIGAFDVKRRRGGSRMPIFSSFHRNLRNLDENAEKVATAMHLESTEFNYI
jgi:hypothetical protein